MAQAPGLVRFNLTFEEMKDSYTNQIEPSIIRQMDTYAVRYEGF